MNNWIETEGSPFVIVEQQYAKQWNGQEDYDAVCSVIDYLGKIYINNHAVLVMCDEPMAVRIIQQEGWIFLDEVIDNGDVGNFIIDKNYTKVLIHKRAENARNESLTIISAHAIETDSNEHETMTFIGGNPKFLQSEVHLVQDMKFCLQFYAGDLPLQYTNLLYLDDAIGYLFIKDDCFGYFFGQCT